MFITIINDCSDDNAKGRQIARIYGLFGIVPTFVGVHLYADLAVSGNLIDMLDIQAGQEGLIFVNVAPRHGNGKKWENGTPFAYFLYNKTIIISTIGGYTLSLAKKLGLTARGLKVVNLPEFINNLQSKGMIAKDEAMRATQFRSLHVLPLIGRELLKGNSVPCSDLQESEIADIPSVIWWVDNFGNCKTTLFKKDIKVEDDGTIKTTFGPVKFADRLKDVADGKPAIIEGSSGLGDLRFLEVVVQGGSASEYFSLSIGDAVL